MSLAHPGLKTALSAAAAVAALLPCAVQAAEEIASFAVETEVKLVSDQRTRGVSDSLRGPGLQLSAQLAHESGVIAMAQLSTVSKKYYTNSDGYNLLLATGYRFGDPDGWHFGAGLAAEFFPGAKFDAPFAFDMETGTPADFRTTKYDTRYLVLEAGWGALEGRIVNVLSKSYRGANTGGVCGQMLQFMADPTKALECYARGDQNARGSLLVDLGYKYSITPRTQLLLHAGYQRVKHFSEANFADYSVGVTHKAWGVQWTAEWMKAATRVRELYQAMDGSKVKAADKPALVLSAAYKF
jgi:hypothetical protein